MFLVLFTLFCVTASGGSAAQPAAQPVNQPVCKFAQRLDWTFNGASEKGWCDRILYLKKGNIETQIEPLDYNAISNSAIDESDHDLVVAYYTVQYQSTHSTTGKKRTAKLFRVLSVTFNIGDKKENDNIKKRFNAIVCSLKTKYGVEKWEKIDIFHFAFQEAKAWWNKDTHKPKFIFGETLKKVTGTWKDKYQYQGRQGALLYIYYNTEKIQYQRVTDSEPGYGYIYDANGFTKNKRNNDKSFTMAGHFYALSEKAKPETLKKTPFIVFGTAHFAKKGDTERKNALKLIETRFAKYNKKRGTDKSDNVILILGADTNFRVNDNNKDSLKVFLQTDQSIKNWKEIANPTFKQTCKRVDKVKFYEGFPDCKSSETPETSKCWSKCIKKSDAIAYSCTLKYDRRRDVPKKANTGGCASDQKRFLCDTKIPHCYKDKKKNNNQAAECVSDIKETKATGIAACQEYSRSLKTTRAYKWKKGFTLGSFGGTRSEGFRFLCGKIIQAGDITPWNDNNYIYNPSTSSSYYMYFMTMAILLMIIILCGIFGLCVGSICFVGAYYYGQRSVKKVNQMDEKYP
eukprot:941375_1